jgi:phosphotriesterase-related protein
MTRRTFLGAAACGAAAAATPRRSRIQTVRGSITPGNLGTTLIHEHILVDFIGAEGVSPSRYDPDVVFRTALPKLAEVRARGCRTLVECTPAYLGRDPALLRRLSEATGLNIVTNTGLYGANKDRHIPKFAYTEGPDELARRWTNEYERGIDGSGIKPGFMKIGVDSGRLSEIDAKLVRAGCLCHKTTGLRLHIHTGNGIAAMEILELMGKHDAPASAYVWVHAQSEKDPKLHTAAAKAGAWLEFDGVGPKTLEAHVAAVAELIGVGFTHQLLISQDSGWYRVGEPGGGQFNGYAFLFDSFLPALRERGVSDAAIRELIVTNPARALTWA